MINYRVLACFVWSSRLETTLAKVCILFAVKILQDFYYETFLFRFLRNRSSIFLLQKEWCRLLSNK